jgi:hypothetical protein
VSDAAGDAFDLIGSPFTISLWVKPSSFATGGSPDYAQTVIGRAVSDTTNGHWSIQTNGTGKIQLRIRDDGSSVYTTSTTTLSTGTFYHVVAGVDDSNNTFIYVNGGTSEDTDALSGNSYDLSASVYFGRSGNGSPYTYYFDGDIDEACIFNRALTESEVGQLYNSGSGLAYPFSVASSNYYYRAQQ